MVTRRSIHHGVTSLCSGGELSGPESTSDTVAAPLVVVVLPKPDPRLVGVEPLDLTHAYAATARSAQRGVRLLDRVVLLQDEIETKAPADVFWFMHTRADITLDQDGRGARLTADGRTLYVRCLAPAGAVFTVMDAVPLPTSPNPKENNRNRGVKKLVIALPHVSKISIAVTFTPEKDQPSPSLTSLTVWR